MPGPCPNGRATQKAHEAARCQDRGNCTGPGCRLKREKRTDWWLNNTNQGEHSE